MKREIDFKELNKWPLTTNEIAIDIDTEAFFKQYSIIRYHSKEKEKNLAYEQLASEPTLSVTGIRERWESDSIATTRFFILSEKGKEQDILKSLRKYDTIISCIDTLNTITEKQRKRIIASLAINTLGKAKKDKMMYNNGSLLLSDDKNFLIKETRSEKVCLRIEINEYMNLTAKTVTFSNPKDFKSLKKHAAGAFQVGKFIDGYLWSGQSVKPVIIQDLNEKTTKLEDYYIQKKRFRDNHNIVKYWPYKKENYTHGKLFAIWQIVELVNKRFESIIKINFKDHDIWHYDEYKTEKETLSLITNELNKRKIYIDDPFKTNSSKTYIKTIADQLQEIMGNQLVITKKEEQDSMVIRLCEPKEESDENYIQSMSRFLYTDKAIQHIIFNSNQEDQKLSKTEARRILLELLIKDNIKKTTIPQTLSKHMQGWQFLRYKIAKDDMVIGAKMKVIEGEEKEQLNIDTIGFRGSEPIDFETFAREELSLKQNEASSIKGTRDYLALKKGGNIYLIIDTDEIPILDAKLIDEGYGIEGENTGLFKRKGNEHKYLRGYINLHVWKTEGINNNPTFTYIAGVNKDTENFATGNMDKMPRARKIIVIHAEQKEKIEEHIKEYCNMLKFGFGRWNQIMTYPLASKYLLEYLDDQTEQTYSKHWSEITKKSELL